MPQYIQHQKVISITGNMRILADGFSSFTVVNTGEADMLLHHLIRLGPGDLVRFAAEPYVTQADDIPVSFSGAGTQSGYAVLTYNTEVKGGAS